MANVRTNDEMLHSREVAEAARETEWQGAGFLRELFLGTAPPRPHPPLPARRAGAPRVRPTFYDGAGAVPARAGRPGRRSTRRGEYPPDVIDGLRQLGAFGMKIPAEYGGLGLTQVEYAKVMQLLGSYDANLTALLSAHQSIGVPQPLKLFGTEELKRKYLPRIAKGAITAFALTEANVGSDPARLATTAEPTAGRQALRAERREALVHERHHRGAARGDGARTRRRTPSAPSSSRPPGPASRSRTAAASWGCGRSRTPSSASPT